MLETGIEVIDAILNNPIQSLVIFGGIYLAYRMRDPHSRKRLKYDIRGFIRQTESDLQMLQLFPAREEYNHSEYILKKMREQD
jgi:hypothetical protein